MNREEFMRQLDILLVSLPREEREAALQYYNDYFDDAGAEKEEEIIAELGNPEEIAAVIRAGYAGDRAEYSERGYQDTRFERMDVPIRREDVRESRRGGMLLWILGIVLIGIPFILPLALTGIALVFAVIVAIVALAGGIFITMAALAITGVVLTIVGISQIFHMVTVGMMLMGSGMILTVIGMVGTVLMAKLASMVIPGMVRFFVGICQKMLGWFREKVVA